MDIYQLHDTRFCPFYPQKGYFGSIFGCKFDKILKITTETNFDTRNATVDESHLLLLNIHEIYQFCYFTQKSADIKF